MAWFNPNDRVVSMAFYDAQGVLNASMDIVPARTTWLGCPDEAIGALAVGMLQSGALTRWNRHAWGDGTKAWEHTLARYGDQALAIHLGAPLPDAAVWRLDREQVVAPDGQRWPAAVFCGGPGLGDVPHSAKDLPLLLGTSPSMPITAPVVRGALLALQGACPQTHVSALCRFLAGCLPTQKGREPGQATVAKAKEQAAQLVSVALGNRIVQGDRAYAPTRLKVLDALFPPEPPEWGRWRALGFEAASIALDSGVPAYALDSRLDPGLFANAGLSAHTTLLAHQVTQRVRDLFRASTTQQT
jgi:hypothetical protein